MHNYVLKYDNDLIQRAYINSPKVVSIAKKYFNCPTIEGVQLEEYGGTGTFGSHWEEKILLGDYMTGVIYEEEQVISEFTLALLEDTGFYKANYYTGGLMKFGKNKGCDFLNKKCVIDNKVNPEFQNEFFNIFDTKYNNYLDPACTSGRQSRVYHYLLNYEDDAIPSPYQYYGNPKIGGRSSANYCPVFMNDIQSIKDIYYLGHCSYIGSNLYGDSITYTYSKTEKNYVSNGYYHH